jgi:photosystem II stability/assembly factor-like uncharacterized protein
MQVCSDIYRSSDGGATWTFVTSQTVTATQLTLPPATFSAGQFYAAGGGGVQVTRNGGTTFVTVLPSDGGTALVPPASSGLDLVFSSTSGLWGIRHDGSAALLSTYGGADRSNGTPVLLHTATGYVVLQGVIAPGADISTPLQLERCTPQCGAPTTLPLAAMGGPRLFASPNVATDHTVYAAAGERLGVSHDDGLTFTAVPCPVNGDMNAVHGGPNGRRLVASLGAQGRLAFSDDDGATWHTAALPAVPLSHARTITELRPGRLIAEMARDDDSGWAWFVCSTDGSRWTGCAPDHG